MTLTRVTTSVLDANAVSADKLANSSIVSRHLGDAVVLLRNLAPEANTASIIAGVNSNTNLLQTNLNTTTGNVNLVQTNVVAAESNVVLVRANIDSYASYANTNLDTKENVSTTYFAALANDFATYTQLNANLDAVQTNVSAISDGATVFSTNKTFNQNVTVLGNLIVVGAQVDLGVGSATISDAIVTLSANLSQVTPPPADSGLLLNRGSDPNVFIGIALDDNHLEFSFTDSPGDNITMEALSFVDVHANAVHTEGGTLSHTAINKWGEIDTGIYFPGSDVIGFASQGVESIRITNTGNLQITNGVVESNAGLNKLELDNDAFADRTNSVTIQSVESVGVFLDSNNDDSGIHWFGIYNDLTTTADATIDNSIFSVREGGEVFITDDASIEGNANIVLDSVVGNAVIASRVFEGGVGLQANDFITYTRLNANVNSVQSNLTTSMNQATANTNLVQDNVTALTSGAVLLIPFTNTNVSTSSSNVYFIGKDVANYGNIVSVTVDGIYQAPVIDYVGNFSNNTVQFTDEALPAGLTITITSLT